MAALGRIDRPREGSSIVRMSEEGAADPIAKPRRKKARTSSKTTEPAERPVAEETDDRVRAADARVMLQRLAGKPAADVLSRISNGDPLRLYPLCARHIRERCYVLDPDRVFERVLAIVAVGIELEAERCAEPAWLAGKLDESIQSVLEHDRAEEQDGLPPDNPEEHFRLFVEAFYIEPPLARLSSVRYNALDERLRRGFQKLLIEGLPLEEVLAMEGLGPPERLQLDILLGLKAIGLIDEEGVEELRWKGEKA
jgi:hypothetical protein